MATVYRSITRQRLLNKSQHEFWVTWNRSTQGSKPATEVAALLDEFLKVNTTTELDMEIMSFNLFNWAEAKLGPTLTRIGIRRGADEVVVVP